jgi:hypothetical protein
MSRELYFGPMALPREANWWSSWGMNASAFHIHQCPFCELRFENVNEVRDHVVTDHPVHAAEYSSSSLSERPSEVPRR